MATSETMSTPDEWMHFYQTNYFSDINQILPQPTDATSFADSMNSNLNPNHGRISKPLRRRARASRRTPTTVFNTDTANFRSMVQRFTGSPISPFAARSQHPGGGETFALDDMNEAAAAGNTPPAAAESHMQYSQYLLHHHQLFTINRMQGGGNEVVSSHAPPGFSSTENNRDSYNYMMKWSTGRG